MDLEDLLHVWLDSVAEPVAVNLVSRGPCTTQGPSTKMWTTNVQVKYPDGGPIPDTATYIHKLEKEREARERGETKDNRSFLAKYVSNFYNFFKQIFLFKGLNLYDEQFSNGFLRILF